MSPVSPPTSRRFPNFVGASWQQRIRRLYADHRHKLESLVARRINDRDAAAEIVQDVFSRVLSAGSRGTVEVDTKILYASVRNAAIEYQRAEGRRRRILMDLRPEQFTWCGHASPDATLEGREALTALDCALLQLSPKNREIFILHRVHGMSNADIAERYGISVSAIEKRIARAMRHCQECLAAHLNRS